MPIAMDYWFIIHSIVATSGSYMYTSASVPMASTPHHDHSQKVVQSASTQGPDLAIDTVLMTGRRFGDMTLKKDGLLTAEGQNIYVICLSRDGRYLALGDDEGGVEIRATERDWDRDRLFFAGAPVHALVWHPLEQSTLFVGSGGGNIHRIYFGMGQDVDENHETIDFGTVPGHVHALAFNEDGSQLAIAYAQLVALIDNPFQNPNDLGRLRYLQTPEPSQYLPMQNYPLPRSVYYLSKKVILVVFFGYVGIIAYSTESWEQIWKMQGASHSGSLCTASSALSPSKKWLAVTNLLSGISWYSIEHRRFMMTTGYTVFSGSGERNHVVNIEFLDDITVVAGHVNGGLIFACLGMSFAPTKLEVADKAQAIQTICAGEVNGKLKVVSIIPYTTRQKASVCLLEIGRDVGHIKSDRRHSYLNVLGHRRAGHGIERGFAINYATIAMAALAIAILPGTLLLEQYTGRTLLPKRVPTTTIAHAYTHTVTITPSPTNVSRQCICTLTGLISIETSKPSLSGRVIDPMVKEEGVVVDDDRIIN